MAGQEELPEGESTGTPDFNIMGSRDTPFINVLWLRQVGVVPPVDVIKALVKGKNETITLEVRPGDDPNKVFMHTMAFHYFYHRDELEKATLRLESAAELAAFDQEDAAIRARQNPPMQLDKGVSLPLGGELRHFTPYWAE